MPTRLTARAALKEIGHCKGNDEAGRHKMTTTKRESITVEEVAADPTNAYQVTVHGDVAIASLSIHPDGWVATRYAHGGSSAGEPKHWASYVRITETPEAAVEYSYKGTNGDTFTASSTCEHCNGGGTRLDRLFPGECVNRDGRCAESGEKLRKNGTCADHECYYCGGNGKLNKRAAFMQAENRLIESALDEDSAITWEHVLKFVRTYAGSASRALRWQQAVAWHGQAVTHTDARWLVTQGQVYLSHGL